MLRRLISLSLIIVLASFQSAVRIERIQPPLSFTEINKLLEISRKVYVAIDHISGMNQESVLRFKGALLESISKPDFIHIETHIKDSILLDTLKFDSIKDSVFDAIPTIDDFHDELFSNLKKLQAKHPMIVDITNHLKNLKKDDYRHFSDLLPVRVRKEYRKDSLAISACAINNCATLNLSGEYVKYFRIFEKMGHKIDALLDKEQQLVPEDVIQAYIESKAENYLIELFSQYLTEQDTRELLERFVNLDQLDKAINNFKEFDKIPPELRNAINGNRSNLEQDSTMLKEYLDNQINQLPKLKNALIAEMTLVLDKLVSTMDFDPKRYSEQINEILLAEESFLHGGSNNQINDLVNIDIYYGQYKSSHIWLRMKISEQEKEQLLKNGNISNIGSEVFVCIKPQEMVFKGNTEKNCVLEKADTVLLKKVMKDIHTEIPTGLSFNNLELSIDESQSTVNNTAYAFIDENQPVTIGFRTSGIWSNYKSDYTKLGQLQERLSLPKSLGVTLKDVNLIRAEKAFDLELRFRWQPPTLIRTWLPSYQAEFTIKILEESVRSSKFPRERIEMALKERIASELNKIESILKEKDLNEFFINSVDSFVFKVDSIGVTGKLSLTTSLHEILDYEEPIRHTTNLFLSIGRENPVFIFENDFSVDLLAAIEKKAQRDLEQFNNKLDHLNLYIKPIEVSFQDKSICTDLEYGLENLNASVCITPGGIEGDFFEVAEQYLSEEIKERVVAELSEECDDLLDKLKRKVGNLYGLPFELKEQKSCEDIKESGVSATAFLDTEFGEIEIDLSFNNGSFEVRPRNFKPLQDTLIEQLKSALPSSKNFTVGRPKMDDSGNLSFDLIFDLSRVGLHGLTEISYSITIKSDGSIHMGEKVLDSLEKAFTNTIIENLNNGITPMLNKYFKKNPITFGKEAGILLDSASFKARVSEGNKFSGKIRFVGEVFANNYKIPVWMELDLENFSLDGPHLKLGAKQTLESLLAEQIRQQLNSISSMICGNCIYIDKNYSLDPLKIEGQIRIEIPDFVSLPAIGFVATKDKFDFEFNPTFRYPAVLPLTLPPPSVYLVNPGFAIDLNAKRINGFAELTIAATPAEVKATRELFRLNIDLFIKLNQLDKIDFTGNLILIKYLNALEGDGYLDFKEARFTLNQRTPFILSKLIDYKSSLDIDAKKRSAKSLSRVNALGVSINTDLEASIPELPYKVDFRGKGDCSIDWLGTRFDAGFESQLYMGNPVSLGMMSKVFLNGEIGLGDADIKTHIYSDLYRATAQLNMLGSDFKVTVPNIKAIDMDLLYKLFFSAFRFDPAVVLKILENLDDIEVNLQNLSFTLDKDFFDADGMGIGGSGDSDREDGVEGEKGIEVLGGEKHVNDGDDIERKTSSFSNNLLIEKVNKTNPYTYTRCGNFFGFDYGCESYTIQVPMFSFNNWPSYFQCLPSSYRDYYLIYDSKVTSSGTNYKIYDILDKEIYTKKIYQKTSTFLSRIPIQTYFYSKEEEFLSLSREDKPDHTNPYATKVDAFSPEQRDGLRLNANFAFTEKELYLFVTAGLYENGEPSICGSSDYQLLPSKRSEIDNLQPKDQLIFKESKNVHLTNYSNSGEQEFKVYIEGDGLIYYEYDPKKMNGKKDNAKVTRLLGTSSTKFKMERNDTTYFNPAYLRNIFNRHNTDQLFIEKFIQAIEREGKLMRDSLILPNYNLDSTRRDTLRPDLDKIHNAFNEFLSRNNVEKGDKIVPVDIGTGDFVILKEGATFNVIRPLPESQRIQNLVKASTELIKKWIPVNDLVSFRNIFQRFDWYRDDMTLNDIFNKLKENDAYLNLVHQDLEEFVKGWLENLSAAPSVFINNPDSVKDDFVIWDYSDTSRYETPNYTYTITSKGTEYSYKRRYYELPLNDVTDSVCNGQLSKGINGQAELIRNTKNYVWYSFLDKYFQDEFDSLQLLGYVSEPQEFLVYGLEDSVNENYNLKFVKPFDPKESNGWKLNESTIRYLDHYPEKDIVVFPTVYKRNGPFFQKVFKLLYDYPGSSALVSAINDSTLFATIEYELKDKRVMDFIWENYDGRLQIIRGRDIKQLLSEYRKALSGTARGVNKRMLRYTLTNKRTQLELHELFLMSFQGFKEWRSHKNSINPFAILDGR